MKSFSQWLPGHRRSVVGIPDAGVQLIDPPALTFASEKLGASGQDGSGRRGTNGLTARYHSIDTESEKRHHFWHAGMRRRQVATDKNA